jgi:hypothetical protein
MSTPNPHAPEPFPVWPLPFDLAENPELAVLAVLDTALHLTVRALVAAHPQLQADEVPYWCLDRSPPFILADSIVSHAQALSEQVAQYRILLLPPDPPAPHHDEDLPF